MPERGAAATATATVVATAVALVAGALLLAGCGSGSSSGTLTVSAAASLTRAFTAYAASIHTARVRYAFAGSDLLAAQIRQGVRPDVFASANTTLPQALYGAGLVERPVVFARNRLVIAVPAGSHRVASAADLTRPGVKLVIGSASVPVGNYARTVLARLPPAQSRATLRNVVSEEPDVTGVVGKLIQGAADAGFLYMTDVDAAKGRLRAIALPAPLSPQVAYGVAVVRGTSHAAAARAFVDGLLRGAGRRALSDAGFEAP